MKNVKLLLFILSFLFIFITGANFVNAEESSGSVTVTVDPSGTISATNCTIALGGDSCNTTLEWSTTNPITTSAVTTPTNITVASANSSTGTSYSVYYGSRNFYLYNNGSLLDSKTAIASCIAGTGWYDGACRTPINGGWTEWSPASCPTACGLSASNQTRSCTNPSPQYGGTDCSGSTTSSCPATAACVCTAPLTEYQTLSCSTGYSGAIYQSRDKSAYPGCTFGSWYTTSDTCTINTYTVSTSAGIGGTISPSSRTVNYGSTTTFTVTPNSGYSIGTVSGCGGSGSSTYTTGAITSACTVSASFLLMTGSLTPSSSSCTIATGASSCNVTLTWSTTNPIGTSAVTASGMTNVNGNSGSQAFSVPYSSRIFYLYNSAILLAQASATSSCIANTHWDGGSCVVDTNTVSTSVGTGGSISPTSRTVNYGSTTTFTVTPNSGYSIGTVSGCGGSGSSTYTTGAITSACTVSATFLLMTGSLTPSSSSCIIATGASSCNVTLSWSTTNPIGTSAVTASGMTNVNGNSGSQAFPVPYSSRIFYLYNSAILLAQASATSSCTANTTWNGSICAINTFTITASSGANGSVTPAGVTTKNYGTSQIYTITPSNNYHIVSVLVDGSSVGAVGSYTFSNITTSHTISASFTIDTYTLTVNKTGTGTGTVTGAGTYNYGILVTATAVANTGSSFTGWSGDCNASGQVTITSAKTCTATFTSVTSSVTASPTTYYTIPNTNVSFAYTPSTNIGTTECRLLDNTFSALTAYQSSSPIVHTPPSSAGVYGYYIQCRNTTHTTVTATSSLITVTVVTVSVSAGTPYNVGPNSSVNFVYTPTTNSGTTECLLLDNVLTPLTAYQLTSPITYTVPNNIGSYGYYVKCRNTTTTTAMANSGLIIVNTACSYANPNTSWNGSACVTPSGWITASNCPITVGNNHCSSNLVWSTTYPIGTSAVTTPTNITVSATNSGTTTYPVSYGSRNFYLYNNSNLLSQATANATCTSGTVWNATTGICEPPTGLLTASGCLISAGNNSCDSTLIWNTNNPLIGITSVVKTPNSSGTIITTLNGGTTTYAVPYNSRAFVLVHNGVILSSATPVSACAQKTTWNGSICELNAPKIDLFTADPSTIFEGRASTLTWSADPDLVTYCTGTGFSTGGLISGTVKVSPIITTTYTLTCGRTGYPSAANTATVKVIVLKIKEQ